MGTGRINLVVNFTMLIKRSEGKKVTLKSHCFIKEKAALTSK